MTVRGITLWSKITERLNASYDSSQITLAGIELMHMSKKDQMLSAQPQTAAQQFYSLAA